MHRFCYPYIVRAVCDGVRGLYEEALEQLRKLHDRASAAGLAHSRVRVAAIAASIGYVHYQRGRFIRRDWMMQFQAMRGLWLSGARQEASDLARVLLEPDMLELPRSREQFFVAGAANWILGNHARAEYDFERSRKEQHWHYAGYLI